MAKHYFQERVELFEQLKKKQQPTKEEIECLEWVLDHMSNKYLDSFLKMIEKKPKIHNERGAGRKRKELPVTSEMIKMRKDSGETLEEIAKSYEMSRSTLYRILKEKVD